MLKALIIPQKIFRSLEGNVKIDSRPYFAKVERSTNFVASQRLSSRHGTCSSLHPTASLASLDQI